VSALAPQTFGAKTDGGAVRTLLADAGIQPTEERIEAALSALQEAAEERNAALDRAAARRVVNERFPR